MKSFETLLVDIDEGGVATVTLNRPEAMNAFNLEMTAEFDDAIWSLERDESVRVIVLTGYAGLTPSLDRVHALVQKPFGAQEVLEAMQKVMLAAA